MPYELFIERNPKQINFIFVLVFCVFFFRGFAAYSITDVAYFLNKSLPFVLIF